MAGKDASGRTPRTGFARFASLDISVSVLVSFLALVLLGADPIGTRSVQAQQAKSAPAATAGSQTAPTEPAKSPPMAVVNGEPITRQTLAEECIRRYSHDVLDSMVSKQILLQACQSQGVTITQQDIEAEIQQVATKFALSVDRWLSLLETERNVNAQQYRNDIIWPTLALRRLASRTRL